MANLFSLPAPASWGPSGQSTRLARRPAYGLVRLFTLLLLWAGVLWTTAHPACGQEVWTSRTSAADNDWTSVTYGNGLFVAVARTGAGNRVMTSPNGINWTARTSAANNAWNSVTYGTVAGNGLFVAVANTGTGNRVMTSPDGINWTARTSPADLQWGSVTYGNGLFVAVSESGTTVTSSERVMTSPDGINWTLRTATTNSWYWVTYGTVAGNGLFVAVANSGTGNRVMTSPDGITWTSRSSAANNIWASIAYGNGLFVAVSVNGTGNHIMTSPNGINWTSRTPAADLQWASVTYANGLFVAVAISGTGNRVMVSPDGINWTSRNSATDNNWLSVTYANDIFVAVATSGTGNRVMTACPSPVITATPSFSVASSGSVTLTASGNDSYLWSNGSTQNPLVLTNVTSATTLSVTGTTGTCFGIASADVSLLTFCNRVVHVTPTGNGTNIGNNWANALPGHLLATALASACSGTTFLVGGGLYKPTSTTTDYTATFRIPSGVEVYGGYTVSGGASTGRVISTSEGTPSSTTFSGDIDNDNTLDEDNSYNVVSMSNVSASTRLDGVVITGGYASVGIAPYNRGGGVYNVASGLGNSSNPTITNCLFDANFGSGGGLYSLANEGTTTSPTISNCRFAHNTGPNRKGAALRIDAYIDSDPANRATANPVITNTVFAQNTAAHGAAFYGNTYFGDVRPTFTNCRFTGNTVTGDGGAMNLQGYAGTVSVTATNCAFTDNTARNGGVAYINGCCGFENGEGAGIANIANMVFQSCTLTGNGASSNGGAVYVDAEALGLTETILTNCVVGSNSAAVGGAIYTDANTSGTAVMGITGSTFTDNRSLGDGGAIYSLSGVAGVQSSTFTGNSAGGIGGAIYNAGSSLTLTGSLVSQNTASVGFGGGIYADQDSPLVLNQTDVIQNQAPQGTGGGIRAENNLTITGGRISQNQSRNAGGGINFSNGVARLTGVAITQNTVTNNFAGGGGFAGGEIDNARFESCTIAQNVNRGSGTGISIGFANSVSVSNTRFEGNIGTNTQDLTGGGGFAASNLVLGEFSSCTFTGNRHNVGGGLSVPENSVVTVANSVFTGNRASSSAYGSGGAIYAYTTSLTITGTQFSQNTANGATTNRSSATGGGAIWMYVLNGPAATARIESSTFTQNMAPAGHGGAVVTQGTTDVGLRLNNVTFSQNQAASRGGAIFDISMSLTVTNSQFTSNTATGAGGGAVYVAAPYSFSHVQWQTNAIGATGNGGALFVDGYNSGTIVNNLFEQNGTTSSGPGGAIFANGGDHVLINTNLNRNAGQTGGAISADANLTLVNCTVNRNAASSGGTAFSGGSDAAFVVQNSIIWNNAPVANTFQGLAQSAITLQNSLIDPTAGTAYTDGGNNKTADPLFTNEAGNDLTLTGCSPAVNAGDNAFYTGAGGPPTDLGGLTRPASSGTVDMGAYEFGGQPGSLTLTITATPSQTVMSGSSVTLTASGGADSYTWSNGSTQHPLVLTNVTSATTLSVTGTTGSCSGTASVAVTLCSLTATITATPGLSICPGGIGTPTGTTLTASGGTTGGALAFAWSNGSQQSAITVSPTSTTAYQLTVSTGGCSATTTATVTVNPAVTASIVGAGGPGNLTICAGQSTTLTASGGDTYLWSNGQMTSVISVSPTSTTPYQVTVTNTTTGCSSTTSVTVTVNPAVAPSIAGNLTLCEGGGSTTLTASGGDAFNWNDGSSLSAITVSPVSTSAYSVTVTNTATGCSSATSVTVNVQTAIVVSIGGSRSVCPGASTTLTASGASSYTWSNGQTGASIVVSPGSATVVSVTGVLGACSAPATATVTVNPAVTATITSSAMPICPGTSATLTASGAGQGGAYRWSTNEITAPISVSPMSSQPYTVTATSAAGCSGTATATVSVTSPVAPATPTLSASSSGVCEGQNVVVVGLTTGTVTGYKWYKDGQLVGGQTSATLTLNGVQANQAGDYTLTILGICGSASSTTFVLTMNPLPVVTIAFPTSASVNPAGPVITVPVGTGLTYQVFGGGSNGRYERRIVLDRINGFEIRTVLENRDGVFPIDKAGPYWITVTDNNGCSRTVTGEIRGQ